jgi:LysR family transcriptional regulator, regulator for genes of the gallate degradation pathway
MKLRAKHDHHDGTVAPFPALAERASGLAAHALVVEPHFRRLRAYLAVLAHGNVHRAARDLHLTASSVSKAIQKLEAEIGLKLFERTHEGMIATDCGRILAVRARRSLRQIDQAEQEIHAAERAHGEARRHTFAAKVTHRQLVALIGVTDHPSETAAAKHLKVSQPALTIALRELERLVGHLLFLRRGMTTTEYGEVLTRRAKLAFAEIEAFGNDLAAHFGQVRGRVVVGVLPLSGVLLAPRAIKRLIAEHPDLQVSIIDGTYLALQHGLRCGEIDVVVGALSAPMSETDIIHEELFEDALSLVVRKGHPLARKSRVFLADLSNVQWVIPRQGTPARSKLDNVASDAGISFGVNPIETNSLLTMRTLLMESDRVAVITRNQIYFDEIANLLETLPIELRDSTLSIGIRTRADAMFTSGVKSLLSHFRAIREEITRERLTRCTGRAAAIKIRHRPYKKGNIQRRSTLE